MRILLVFSGSYPLGFGHGSGAENAGLKVANLMHGLGHQIDIIAHEHSKIEAQFSFIPINGDLDEALDTSTGSGDRNPAKIIPNSTTAAIWTRIGRILSDYDCLFCISHDWLPFYLTRFLEAITPVAHWVVFSAGHTVIDDEIRQIAVDSLAQSGGGKNPDAVSEIVAPKLSILTESQAASYGVPKNSYTISEYGLDLDQCTFEPECADPKFLAWAGRILPDKGLLDAVKVAKLADMPLHIAGGVCDQLYWDQVQQYAKDNDCQIKYHGKLAVSDLRAMLGQAYGFLMTPKWIEAMGIVVMESLACGTPVLTYNRGGPGDLVEDGQTGFVLPPDDIDAMARAVPRLAEINRAHCRKVTEQLWSDQVFGRKMERWIQNLVSQHQHQHKKKKDRTVVDNQNSPSAAVNGSIKS